MKKKTIYIIIGVLIVVGIIAAVFIINYYKKLDGRACMDCPYVYDLTVDDIIINNKIITSNGTRNGYKAIVDIGTVNDSIKIDGKVTLEYTCNVNYCFSSSMIQTQCTWNYPANGFVTIEFNNSTSENKTFDIKPANSPSSIYMYQNSINCSITVSSVSGKLKIYGERIR